MAATLIYNDVPTTAPTAHPDGDDLWMTPSDLKESTGWEIKPEGVCREDICIPVPEDRRNRFLESDGSPARFNLAEFARLIEQPIAREEGLGVWYFGAPGWEWKGRLSGGTAPNFTLPDFQGRMHSLRDYRGKKLFLLCWASW